MNKLYKTFFIFLLGILCLSQSCQNKKSKSVTLTFTEADSLTGVYLNLQDSILLAWNRMINNDNQKIKAMHALLHEIQHAGSFDSDQLKSLEHRVLQLKKIRFTPKNMNNTDVVDEYDFATNSLVSEIISLVESHPAYASNSVLQKLVEQIRTRDQQTEDYRNAYDNIVLRYNSFIDDNHERLKEINVTGSIEKKTIFQTVSD